MAKKLKPLVLSPKEKAYIEATAYGETRHVPQSKKGLVFSPDGARGRLQIMPETYKEMMGSMEGWDNPKKLEEAGKRFAVKQFRDFKGDVRKAAGAYVRGPTAERKNRPKGPRTKKYIPEVVAEYKKLMANVSDNSTKGRRKTTMVSKNEISKRLKSAKEGKPTWQDKARLKTWKAYKAGSQKTQGYQRAKRNIKKDKQMGRKPNEVDLQIVKSYVPQTKDQMKADRIKAGIWAAGMVGGPAVGKVVSKVAAPFVRGAIKKITGSAAKETAKKATKREAANLKRSVARARAAAEKKKGLELLARTRETAQVPHHARIVKAAGTRAANRAGKEGAAKQTAKKVSEQAAKIRRNQIRAGAGLAGTAITAAGIASLRGDTPKKSAAKKPKAKTKPPKADAQPKAAAKAGAAMRRSWAEERKARAKAGAAMRRSWAEEDRKAAAAEEKRRSLAAAQAKAAAKKEKRGYDFFKGGLQKVTLPKLLGGREVEVDSRKEAFDYMDAPELNLKRGGQLKKKTKPPNRAALRGHRAELRGG